MSKTTCNYHGTQPASWECDECARHFCGKCVVLVDEARRAADPRCPLCQNHLTFLGTGQTAKAFWTVAPMFFTYPLRGSGAGLVLLLAAVGWIVGSGFFALPFMIFGAAAIIRYGFAVLTHVATGESSAPPLMDALASDEEGLFWKFLGILIAFGGAIVMVSVLVGSTAGILLMILMSLRFPSMIIFLAAERTMISAFMLNRQLWLITRIGWPYALVVFLSNVLSTGPMLVISMIPEDSTAPLGFAVLMSSMAYFGVVNFAMLGYVLFENQRELGFVAGSIDDVTVADTPGHRLDRLFGTVNVLAKEGRHQDAIKQLELSRTEFGGDTKYLDRAMALALNTRSGPLITTLTDDYLALLIDKNALDQAFECARRSMQVLKSFRPSSASVSHALAEEAFARNLHQEALRLLVNLHKRAPDYHRLGDAYRLAARIFREGVGDEQKALQLESFVAAKGY